MKIWNLTLIGLIASQAALADCKALYAEKIKKFDGMLNPARTLMIANGTSSVAVPLALTLSGANITAGAVVAAPAVLVGAGTYFGIVYARKRSFEKSLRLIVAAEKGNTKDRLTNRLVKRLARENPGATIETLQAVLYEANKTNAFCAENPVTGSISLYDYRNVRAFLRATFSLETAPAELDAQIEPADIGETI